jgi:predicted RNA-binding protein associated with RNAse of E/G family
VGMDGMAFPVLHHRAPEAHASHRSTRVSPADERDLMARLREEQVSDREMDHAIRTTRQRLDILEQMMSNRKADRMPAGEPVRSEL